METVIKDAQYCLNIINGYCISKRGIGKIYRNTNEDLSKIITKQDIKGKTILSVLASSDQVLSCYYLGAKSVDTFDSNKLTYYYFFLKKWTILATGKSYIPASNLKILDILEFHNESQEEINAYYFWKYIIKNLTIPLYYSNLFYRSAISYSLPYKEDETSLAKIIKTKQLNYHQMNLFKPIEKINKKYQVIILSNILEYLYDDIENYSYQSIAAKNINNLLESMELLFHLISLTIIIKEMKFLKNILTI